MKKILIVIVAILVFAISGCKKDIDYNCQITTRNNDGYETWKVADYYVVDSGVVELHMKNETVLEYDLDTFVVFCSEMEIVE